MTPRRVAILQSSYIPWRGYFMIVKACDLFVVLDTVQFTRRDWRSRNLIRTASGPSWLTVPLRQRGRYLSPIDEMVVAEGSWTGRHYNQIRAAYAEAEFADSVLPELADLYRAASELSRLTDINLLFLKWVCDRLDIRTPMVRDADLLPRKDLLVSGPTDRLVQLTLAAGGTSYLSGPSAQSYLDVSLFKERDLSVEWADYTPLAPYKQVSAGYEHQVSIVDALLNLGFTGAREAVPSVP